MFFVSKPCFCPVPKRGCFDENGENDEFAFYPLKTRASLFRPPKTTKMAKMVGVTQAKASFRKKKGLFFPEFRGVPNSGARGPPQVLKKNAPRMQGQNLSCGFP